MNGNAKVKRAKIIPGIPPLYCAGLSRSLSQSTTYHPSPADQLEVSTKNHTRNSHNVTTTESVKSKSLSNSISKVNFGLLDQQSTTRTSCTCPSSEHFASIQHQRILISRISNTVFKRDVEGLPLSR